MSHARIDMDPAEHASPSAWRAICHTLLRWRPAQTPKVPAR